MAVSKCAGVSFSNPAEIVAGDNIDVVGDKDSVTISLSEDVTIAGDLTVNGTVVTLNTETLLVEDKNIEMGVVGSPTDSTANGGGITLKGATDKTLVWDITNGNWTANQDFNLPTGKTFKINNVDINTGGTLSNVAYKDQENTFTQAQTVTVASTVNDVGITVNQNDTTNNPKAVVITNTGTGDSLEVDTTALVVKGDKKVGVNTSTPASAFEVNGFTKLGSDAPAVKLKTFTGTTASTEGDRMLVAHGLSAGKILLITLKIEHATDSFVQEEYTGSVGYQSDVGWDATYLYIGNHATNSENILTKAFTVLVTYAE